MSNATREDAVVKALNLKVVVLGDSGVGKTCLRSQFIHHVFTNAYKATIGGDYLTTTVKVGCHMEPNTENTSDVPEETYSKVNLQIWDTAGQERFNSISQAFYRGTDVVVLVYDITNFESVLSLRNWFRRFLTYCSVRRPGVLIVGNKSDKVNERCVDLEEIRELLTNNFEPNVENYVLKWQDDLKEVSSKKLDQVQDVFMRVAEIGLELSLHDRGDTNSAPSLINFDEVSVSQNFNSLNAGSHSSSTCSC